MANADRGDYGGQASIGGLTAEMKDGGAEGAPEGGAILGGL